MLEEHLGGPSAKTHTDEGNFKLAIQTFDVNPMLDIGCGPGGMVELANNIGVDAFGVDGDYTLQRYDESKSIHDFPNMVASITKQYDLGWSVEFVEHVYEKYIPLCTGYAKM